MTEEKRHRLSEYGYDPDRPRRLPYSDYPNAKDVAQHGIQPLPASLPLVDFAGAEPFRSSRYTTVLATKLTRDQLLQMAWVIAVGFVGREPQARHLRPPKHPPAGTYGGAPHRSFRDQPVRFVGHRDADVLDSASHRPDRPHQFRTWMGSGVSLVRRSTRRCRPWTWTSRFGRTIHPST